MAESSQPIGPNNRVGLRQLAKNSLINFFRQGYSIILALIISILLARGLGKEARGIYTLCLLLPELLVTILNFGVSASSVYFVSRQDYPISHIISQGISLSTWISLITLLVGLIVITFFGTWIFPDVPFTLLLLSLLVIPINMYNSVLTAVFQGMQDFRSFNIPGMLTQAAMLGSIFLLVWVFKFEVVGAIISYFIGSLTATISLSILIRRKIHQPLHIPFLPDPLYFKSVLQYGIQAHLSNLLGFLSYRMDNFILNGTAGPAAVGIYSIAVGLGERFWLPGNAINSALFPRIASLHKEKNKQNAITPLVARVVFWVTLPMAITVALVSRWLIPFFYGDEFLPSIMPFIGIMPGIILLSVGKILANDMAGRGRVDLNLVVSGIGFLINLLANIILIPKLGPLGAALASTISYSLNTIMFIFTFWKITAIPWYQILLIQKSDIGIIRQAFGILKANLNLETRK